MWMGRSCRFSEAPLSAAHMSHLYKELQNEAACCINMFVWNDLDNR